MGKFVLTEPPAWTDRRVTLNMTKPDKDERLEIYHGDTDEKIAQLRIERTSRNVILELTGSKKLVIDETGGSADTIVSKEKAFPTKASGKKTWKVEKGKFKCWLPNGSEIELDIVDPGPFTPKDEPFEIVGQPEMMFALALGIKMGKNTLLTGPTGIGKTTMYRWLGKKLGYNVIVQPIARGTQDRHLLGEYAPAGPGDFRWMDGPVTRAARLSRDHPTILVFDEINRIGNVAEFSRVYSVLDDTKMLELPERRHEAGEVEKIECGKIMIGATSNPTDDDGADYIGVKELDPAFVSRFPLQPKLEYPTVEVEAKALKSRVPDIDERIATKMCQAAKRIRESADVRFPISFRELEAWALCEPLYGYEGAAEIAVISKSQAMFRPDIRNLLSLQKSSKPKSVA